MFSRKKKRYERLPPGEYPESFKRAWIQQTLPSTHPAEARRTIEYLRSQGWDDDTLARDILPFMPVDWTKVAPNVAPPPVPPRASPGWFDANLPSMSADEIRLVVRELESRGWPARDTALTILPHLLPKLSASEADAILAGLSDLGASDEDIARLQRCR